MWWQWWFIVASAVLVAEALVRGLEALWRAACAHLDRRQAEAEQEAHEALRATGRVMQFEAPAPASTALVAAIRDAQRRSEEDIEQQWPYTEPPFSTEQTGAMPVIPPRESDGNW